MKLATTVLGLKVHYYSDLNILDLTNYVRIGGAFSSHLQGPIPASLLPAGAVVVGVNGGPPIQPPNPFQLPKYTKQSAQSQNPKNWLT
jgi:hypothetical protein